MSANDAVDGSSTGNAMCHFAVGYSGAVNVSLWHKADVPAYVDLCLLSGVKRTLTLAVRHGCF
jgi:hypothetical protein